jgi:hypothetical protein
VVGASVALAPAPLLDFAQEGQGGKRMATVRSAPRMSAGGLPVTSIMPPEPQGPPVRVPSADTGPPGRPGAIRTSVLVARLTRHMEAVSAITANPNDPSGPSDTATGKPEAATAGSGALSAHAAAEAAARTHARRRAVVGAAAMLAGTPIDCIGPTATSLPGQVPQPREGLAPRPSEVVPSPRGAPGAEGVTGAHGAALPVHPRAMRRSVIVGQIDASGIEVPDASPHVEFTGKPPSPVQQPDSTGSGHRDCSEPVPSSVDTTLGPQVDSTSRSRGQDAGCRAARRGSAVIPLRSASPRVQRLTGSEPERTQAVQCAEVGAPTGAGGHGAEQSEPSAGLDFSQADAPGQRMQQQGKARRGSITAPSVSIMGQDGGGLGGSAGLPITLVGVVWVRHTEGTAHLHLLLPASL